MPKASPRRTRFVTVTHRCLSSSCAVAVAVGVAALVTGSAKPTDRCKKFNGLTFCKLPRTCTKLSGLVRSGSGGSCLRLVPSRISQRPTHDLRVTAKSKRKRQKNPHPHQPKKKYTIPSYHTNSRHASRRYAGVWCADADSPFKIDALPIVNGECGRAALALR